MNELSFLYKENVLQEGSINLADVIIFKNSLGLFNINKEDIFNLMSVFHTNTNNNNVSHYTDDLFSIFKYSEDSTIGYYNFISKIINNYLIYSMIESYQEENNTGNDEKSISKEYILEKKLKLEKALVLSILAMNPIDREFMLSKLNEAFIESYYHGDRQKRNVFLEAIIESAKSCVLNYNLKAERFIDCLPISQIKRLNISDFKSSYLKNEHYLYFTIMKCFAEANKVDPSILRNWKVVDDKISMCIEDSTLKQPLFLNYKSYFDLASWENYLNYASNKESSEYQRGVLNLNKVKNSMIDIFLKSLVLKDGDSFSNENNFKVIFPEFLRIVINKEMYQKEIIKICKEQLSTDEYSVKDILMVFAISSSFKKHPDSFYQSIGCEWVNGLFEFNESYEGEAYKGSIEINLNKFMKIGLLSNIAGDNVALKKMTGSDFKNFDGNKFNIIFEQFLLELISLDNSKLLKKEAKELNSLLLNYEADDRLVKSNRVLEALTGKMYESLNLYTLKKDLFFLEPSFRLKDNKYIIETNDRNKALFIKSYVKNFLLASRDMENEMKNFIEEYLMKKDIEDVKSNKSKLRKF